MGVHVSLIRVEDMAHREFDLTIAGWSESLLPIRIAANMGWAGDPKVRRIAPDLYVMTPKDGERWVVRLRAGDDAQIEEAV